MYAPIDMHRVQIYFLIFVALAVLTPTVFFWELPNLLQKAFALHIIPEVLCLFFFGLWLTGAAIRYRDKYPTMKREIKRVLVLTALSFGAIMLILSYLLLGRLEPYQFTFFLWGLPMLVGYLVETKIISKRVEDTEHSTRLFLPVILILMGLSSRSLFTYLLGRRLSLLEISLFTFSFGVCTYLGLDSMLGEEVDD